jgi:hypothetical protein
MYIGKAELGDKRRTKLLVTFAADMAVGIGKSIVKASRDDNKRTGRVSVKTIWEGWGILMQMLDGHRTMGKLIL